ncbi:MAG: RES family NAD+ phosphorylase [Bryobacteraceae bacterium]
MEDIPVALRYAEIETPDAVSTETVGADALGRNGHADLEATRQAGDEWLRSRRAALLRVPSVIVPATWNVLINPRHPESAQIRIVRVHNHPIDRWLLR